MLGVPRAALLAAAACLLTLRIVAAARAQDPSGDRVSAARALMQTRSFDSAAALLVGVTTDTGATLGQRAEAWMWLGLVRYYLGDDSATARAFRAALALDPKLDAAGLERIDPALAETFHAAQAAKPWCNTETPCASVGILKAPPTDDAVHSCVPKCERGLRRPVLIHIDSRIDPAIPTRALFAPGGAPGLVMVEGTVNRFGRIERGSVRIVTATTIVAREVVEALLLGAEFRPGMLEGQPTRVTIQLRYECRREGTGGTCYFR